MYINLIQIAESFGVSESVVEGWVRNEGLPHTWDRDRLLFDRVQVAEWAAQRGLAARAGFLAPESAVFATGCRLEPLLRAGGIWRGVEAKEVPGLLDRIVASLPGLTPPVMQMLTQRLRAANGVTWAPIGDGFALPHPSARIALGRGAGTLALVMVRGGMEIHGAETDGVPITRLLFFIAPSPRAHLEILGRLGRLLSNGWVRDLLRQEAADEKILAAFSEADRAASGSPLAEGKR